MLRPSINSGVRCFWESLQIREGAAEPSLIDGELSVPGPLNRFLRLFLQTTKGIPVAINVLKKVGRAVSLFHQD